MSTLVSYQKSATILSGQSLSDLIAVGDGRAAAVLIPSAWTAGDLTVQVSMDNGATLQNLYDKDGNEYTIKAAIDRHVLLPIADWLGIRHFKFRSGTSALAVNQGADRALKVRLVG